MREGDSAKSGSCTILGDTDVRRLTDCSTREKAEEDALDMVLLSEWHAPGGINILMVGKWNKSG